MNKELEKMWIGMEGLRKVAEHRVLSALAEFHIRHLPNASQKYYNLSHVPGIMY